jgi:hypothetical protein
LPFSNIRIFRPNFGFGINILYDFPMSPSFAKAAVVMRLSARYVLAISVIAVLGLSLTLFGVAPKPHREIDVPGGTANRLAHALSVVRTSTATSRQVLRILFYGQSITSTKWTDLSVDHLKKTYPNTEFVARNMAIGGFDATQLERTVERDLAEFYPDLVVFHVYGDHHAYERIIRIIRSKTAAEVIMQTDHVVDPVEPLCPEGFRLTLTLPRGCKGRFYLRQRSWEEYMSSVVIPDLASRYGLAVEPQRTMWNTFLLKHQIEPTALLADGPHPNQDGWLLMAKLFNEYFDGAVSDYRDERSNLVAMHPWPSERAGNVFEFEGNRVEILAERPLNSHVTAWIDGTDTSAIHGCWQTSRTSNLANVPDWPAIKQVTVSAEFNQHEVWTAAIGNFNEDQTDFDFTISAGRTGPDGQGRGAKDFVSPSGRIRIASADWTIARGFAVTKNKLPRGFEINWSENFVCQDLPLVHLGNGAVEVRHVLATGLSNGPHRLTLQIDPSVKGIKEIRVYRPPLH